MGYSLLTFVVLALLYDKRKRRKIKGDNRDPLEGSHCNEHKVMNHRHKLVLSALGSTSMREEGCKCRRVALAKHEKNGENQSSALHILS